MDTDKITSPTPVFPGGSDVASNIPLLDSESPASPTSDALPVPVIPTEVQPGTSSPQESKPPVGNAAAVTIVEDAIVTPEAVRHTEDTLQPQSLKDDHRETQVAQGLEIAAQTTDPLGDRHDETSLASPPAVPLGLPAGVDLQALLNSFASASAAPVETQTVDVPQTAQTVSHPTPTPASLPSAQPVAPWQAQKTAPSSVAAANTAVVSQKALDDASYEQFLVDEKRIMGNTAPHEFEPGSRLFVGNLSIETTSKREIFLIFRKYGKLAQVSLKSTYGFVQYLTARECKIAMDGEQGIEIGGRKLHLEISKPQPVRGSAAASQPRRRSRSPVRRSEGRHYPDRRESTDPYGRSPPGRRNSPGRFHTPYDNPYAGRRSHSPVRGPPDDVLLPPRYGPHVPEIQIVVLDESDRAYIHWVETSIRQSGLRVDTLFLSPRLGLPAVVRQMVKEGILAIVQCDRQLQMTNKVTLQVFDRSQGSSNVRFDEYAGLDVATAIGLLKRTQHQQSANIAPPSAPPQQANLAAMIASMDPASLQQVIGALSQQQNQPGPPNQGYPGSYPYRR